MQNMKLRPDDDIEKLLADAWLNLPVREQDIVPQFYEIPEFCSDRPELYISWVLSQPDFFYFTCKEILGIELLPFQCVILKELWQRKFPMLVGSRGMSKSFLLSIYSLLRLMFCKNRKVIICGAAFRQSKIIFQYMETMINNSPILRDIVFYNKQSPILHHSDCYRLHIGDSMCSALPVGDGGTIRGQRANDIITDEFHSLDIDVFETVIAGFAAVSSAPADNVRKRAREKLAEKLGIELIDSNDGFSNIDNQLIISGTAYYDFNHFAQYHKRWIDIIKSRGNKERLKLALASDDIPPDLDWKHFSVIRLPYDVLPEGFMDMSQISRNKATFSSSNFQMEYGAIFCKDSAGFFKRSLIEDCTVQPDLDWVLSDGTTIKAEDIYYEPLLRGEKDKQYIFAVDPAAKRDNFSIVIIEKNEKYKRIVYCWTTNAKNHAEKLNLNLIKENNYYAYCVRMIRELMKKFNCIGIGIDMGGGGIAVCEAFRDEDKLLPGELPIYSHHDYDHPRDTDGKPGLHITYEIDFKASWLAEANHGLKKDLEDKNLIFPYVDAISFALAQDNLDVEEGLDEQFKEKPANIDPVSEVIFEIEELKNELSMIVITETPSGKEHWDTPEFKTGTGKKGRLKKDRYSALLIGNWVCRKMDLDNNVPKIGITEGGGFATTFKKLGNDKMFTGPEWLARGLEAAYR